MAMVCIPTTPPAGSSIGPVQALLEDRNGILWIGGAAGLQRFDGKRYATVALGNGSAAPAVTVLHEDGNGRLWIGTAAGALYRCTAEGVVQMASWDNLAPRCTPLPRITTAICG